MWILMTLSLALGFCAQDDRGREAHALIEKLRSERIDDRDQASLELRKLGPAAMPELEKAATDPDLEISTRARELLLLIRLKDLFGIDLKDANALRADHLVQWMEKKTGRTILYSPNLGLSNTKIRLQEALLGAGDPYLIGVDLLKLENLALAPLEGAPGTVELFPAALGSKRALKIYTSAAELPKANEFCQLVIHVRHVSPRDVQASLINVVSFPQNCLSIEDAGMVQVIDYSSILRKCAEQVKEMDVARGFRISVALLEGSPGAAEPLPEPFREVRLPETIPLQSFRVMGKAALRIERAVKFPQPAGDKSAGNALRFPGSPPYLVEFDGLVRAAGGPVLNRFTLIADQERPVRIFEGKLALQDEKWACVGVVPAADGASLIILARAVPE